MAGNQMRIPMARLFAAVFFLLLVIAGAFLIYPARIRYRNQQKHYAALKEAAERKRAERDALAREVADLQNSPAAVEKVARVKFRLCKEGELVLYYQPSASETEPAK